MLSRKQITAALMGLLLLVAGGWLVKDVGVFGAAGDELPGGPSGLPVAELSELPPEAAQTLRLVEAGGPFPHPGRDGSAFGNREGLLPDEEHGYYREYTVPTPGSPDRGARRLVTGEADEIYYTGDHYQSFVVVDPDG